MNEATPYRVLVDCGSTTTKVVLVGDHDGRFGVLGRAEAATTVEAPHDDVTVGLRAALTSLAEETGAPLLTAPDREGDRHLDPHQAELLATSSAAGGLRMAVVGLVRAMTAASGERAALGAGALVSDVLAYSDPEPAARQIQRLRRGEPDAVLLCGGTDGGATEQVVVLAERIAKAELRSRHAAAEPVPVVYAGNAAALAAVTAALGAVPLAAPNVRAVLEHEDLGPARERIHDVFLHHVMSRAPGYPALQALCAAPVEPTPAAFAHALELLVEADAGEVLAVDIGGATTDVYSAGGAGVVRSVAANLGLSFSIGHVCHAAGWDRVERWLTVAMGEQDLRNLVRNKMVRPTTLPETEAELQVEQAVVREALRLALAQHVVVRSDLRGVRPDGPAALRLGRTTPAEGIDWRRVTMVVGSGGPLAHAPQRWQAAAMLVDGLRPRGITALTVDASFLLPHVGVLSRRHRDAARQVLFHDCLRPLGTVVAPLRSERVAVGAPLLRWELRPSDAGETRTGVLRRGELQRLPLYAGASAALHLEPAKGVDLGAGRGVPLQALVGGGPAGVLLDGREEDLERHGRGVPWQTLLQRWRAEMEPGPGEES
ncbi:MAG: glutamate mutase L [Candidatus Krumholzibacteriia bacterium]